MGMFDYVRIDAKLLPFVANLRSDFFDNEEFQTKSLENCLLTYEITENALMETNGDEIIKIIDFHGIIRFYVYIDDIWYEFVAKYTDGKLVDITHILSDE